MADVGTILFMTSKTLPTGVTTLDLIKTFAVICMILDHVGFYFFPEAPWFRVVGRLGGAPIWFFLVGYASSRDIPKTWMIGALALAVTDFALMGSVFSMNVLVTLIFLRLLIDPVMVFVMKSRYLFWLSAIILAFCFITTNMIVEYGTLAVLCGIFGYITKNRRKIERFTFFTKTDYKILSVVVLLSCSLLQSSAFGFSFAQSVAAFVALAGMTALLSQLKVETIPQITGTAKTAFLQFCGRQSLEIYVVHLLVFKIAFWGLFITGFYQ
ncbi:MAG: hypothetical protein COB76_04060 [Alphaproteobacteria bacterium]|nr:MAG: hypothetical protein COB76_04060 [Alphaproteobacteria bacterium]